LAASNGHGKLALIVVGPGSPYSASEISKTFGLPVLAEIPWSPNEAAVLSDGENPPRKFTEKALMRSIRSFSLRLDIDFQVERDKIAGTRAPGFFAAFAPEPQISPFASEGELSHA
jgi:hypothetical protein